MLRSLDLSNNNLPSVPPDTATNLTQLRYLDLSNNDLTTVPVVCIYVNTFIMIFHFFHKLNFLGDSFTTSSEMDVISRKPNNNSNQYKLVRIS